MTCIAIDHSAPQHFRRVLSALTKLAKGDSEMSENASERVSRLLREVAGNRAADELIAHAIHRAARRLRWEYGRTKRLWYREARRIDADELLAIESYLRKTRDERDDICQRIARLEAAMGIQDADFHRPQIDALRQARRGVGSPVGG